MIDQIGLKYIIYYVMQIHTTYWYIKNTYSFILRGFV